MSFRVTASLDPEKVFLVQLTETAGRLDPSFHRPLFRRRRAELDSSRFDVASLGSLEGRIFQGVGRNLVEDAPTILLKVKNITLDGEIDFSDTEPIADVPKSKLLVAGDIISPFIGAAIKGYKFAKFTAADRPCAVDNNTGVIRITDPRVSSDYLHVFCQTGLVHWQLDQLVGGGGVPFLGSEYAGRIRLTLPPRQVQEKAVALFRAAQGARGRAELEARSFLQSIDNTMLAELGIPQKPEPPNTIESRMFRRMFSRVTGRRIDPASNWKTINLFSSRYPLQRLCDLAFINPQTRFPRMDPETPVSFVPMEAVSDQFGEIMDRQTREVGKSGTYTCFQDGDVIMAKITPCMENGKAAFVTNLEHGCGFGSTEFHVFRPRNTTLSARFLLHLLRLRLLRQHARLNFTGTSGHQRVDEQFFYRLEIPLPPRTEQDRIADEAEDIKERAQALINSASADLERAKREIEEMILGKESKP